MKEDLDLRTCHGRTGERRPRIIVKVQHPGLTPNFAGADVDLRRRLPPDAFNREAADPAMRVENNLHVGLRLRRNCSVGFVISRTCYVRRGTDESEGVAANRRAATSTQSGNKQDEE